MTDDISAGQTVVYGTMALVFGTIVALVGVWGTGGDTFADGLVVGLACAAAGAAVVASAPGGDA